MQLGSDDRYMTNTPPQVTVWSLSVLGWLSIFAVVFVVGFAFQDGIRYMLMQWERPEYNYGYLIPILSIFLVWQKRDELQRHRMQGSWLGIALVLLGLAAYTAGTIGAVYSVVHYAMVLVLAGLALASLGTERFRTISVALLLLLFMIPLPGFLYQTLSNDLQLLSSQIGVGVIRLFGISVFLEGNVIDLGTMKLQVVEACSGLRYLFPLMTLGFIAAYFFNAALWKRAVVFLSTIPITVLMNSFRIGMIGILVEYWGKSQAEGFLHDFEGWIIFMACTAVLVLEMWLLSRTGKNKRPLREVFGIDLPPPTPKDAVVKRHPVPAPFVASIALVAVASALSIAMPQRVYAIPQRAEFGEFPMSIAEWRGQQDRLEKMYIDALNFDDYLMANYADAAQPPVNLYIGYYAVQHADKVPHSPRACIPGGGWAITDFSQRKLATASLGDLQVNRAIIQRGEHRHLVYYWFKQRDRNVTHEYLVKWYIFWDALTKSRTDGALVRLTTPVLQSEALDKADQRLTKFAQGLVPTLARYVPD